MSLPIPEIPEELGRPIRSLLLAANMFRGLFVQIAEGRGIHEVLAERGEELLLAERVIDRWSSHCDLEAHQDLKPRVFRAATYEERPDFGPG